MIELYEALKAASYIMAKTDVRYYLNGVHVIKKNGAVTVESTNGHMCFQSKSVNLESVKDDELDVIITGDSINTILKLGKDLVIKDGAVNGVFKFEVVDGNYPQMDRVIPPSTTELFNGPLIFDMNYAATLSRSIKAVCGNKNSGGKMYPTVNGSGMSGAIRVECSREGVVWVLMPMRDWVK